MSVVLLRLSCIFGGAVIIVVSLIAPALAQSCLEDMHSNMQQMAQNALQCGESADAMRSITGMELISSQEEEYQSMCDSGEDVDSQLSALNECSRVYVCASLAYAFAIQNIDDYGGDCTAAAQDGLNKYPVQ